VTFRTLDLDGFVELLRQRGVEVDKIETGSHERRTTATDPSGNRLVLYEPLKPS
jgi:hypothetical protein